MALPARARQRPRLEPRGRSVRYAVAPFVRLTPILTGLSVLLASVASGSLECEPGAQGQVEARGAEVYALMCAVCHGASGEGYKADHAPALAQRDFLGSVTDEFLRAAIADGRWGSTMSAWGLERGGPLAKGDVESVVAFLRSRAEGRAALDESPLRRGGNAEKGGAVYARECAQCHGARGTGGTAESIGNPQLLSTASNGFLRYAIANGRPATPMPGFRATLGDDAIDDVIALLRTWETAPAPALARRATPARPPPLPLGPVPLNPHGPEPAGFRATPGVTSAATVKGELDRGARMGILDARAPSDYANEHITGAVSVPFYDPSPYLNDLPRDAWLVCYCACPHAESGQLAAKLVAKGFTKVTVLDEGLGFWRAKKYGTTQGVLP